jgi:hypothetical protein
MKPPVTARNGSGPQHPIMPVSKVKPQDPPAVGGCSWHDVCPQRALVSGKRQMISLCNETGILVDLSGAEKAGDWG